MTAAYHHNWGFSIKNPTIESEVSWSSLLSFLHFRRTEFSTDAAVNPDRVPASSPEKICIFWNPAKLQGFKDSQTEFFSQTKCGEWLFSNPKEPKTSVSSLPSEKS